jgi:bis(5'-nucleosyl)-tetraphosphatase (symmetrical)
MATYAIGDIQGCYDELQQLLAMIAFDASKDRVLFVGDLVNRGPDSLKCLRFIKSLGEAATTVLGNHDLHLLAFVEGIRKLHKGDTLAEILNAPDRDDLIAWLRHRPLMHIDGIYAVVHAGLLPEWSIAQALSLAKEVETQLQAANYRDFLASMYGNKPNRWDDGLVGFDRLRIIVNAMTRLRFCSPDGRMDFDAKGEVSAAPPGCVPWFDAPGRKSADTPIICGHWSALGLRIDSNLIALDSGCVWGGELTAIQIEDRSIFQTSCKGYSAW